MKFLVTGASGMLGANLARFLVREEHDVRALVRRPLKHPLLDGLPIETATGDVTDFESCRQAASGCDGLFHVAGYISYLPREWRRCREVNVDGTRIVLDAAAAAGVDRAVITSSTAAVGIPLDGQPLRESDAFDRRFEHNPYMATKREAEQLALARRDIDVVAANPSTIYGAGDVKMNTGVLFRRIAAGKFKWAPPGGSAVVAVDDCVRGHWDVWDKGQPGKRYILSSFNEPLSVIATAIAKSLDAEPPRGVLSPSLFPLLYAALWCSDQTLGRLGWSGVSRFTIDLGFRKRYFCSDLANNELGWRPSVSLEQMMQEAADFYREHGLLPPPG